MQKKKTLLALSLLLIPTQLLMARERGEREREREHTQPVPVTTQPNWVITPAVAPEVLDRANVEVGADFIWWKSYLGGMEYAMSGLEDGNAATSVSVNKGKIKYPPFSWAPGLKVSLGIDSRLDAWNATAAFTVLFTDKEHTSVHYDATKGLASAISVAGFEPGFYGVDGLSTALCSWRQQFYTVDLELARSFFICKTISLRPQFGLKLSWIEEKFFSDYTVTGTALVENRDAHLSMRQRQWGIGIRGGIDGLWRIIKEFGIYGDFNMTGMWNSFRVNTTDVNTFTLESFDGFSPTILTQDNRLFEVLPIFELGIGFDYSMWFNNNTCLFVARAGWEQQMWLDFNQFVLPLNRLHGNLSLHGLTIKFGFTF
jgi:hypothetical protein